jgi:hypothetical protein
MAESESYTGGPVCLTATEEDFLPFLPPPGEAGIGRKHTRRKK